LSTVKNLLGLDRSLISLTAA